jgi:hypothetical protein
MDMQDKEFDDLFRSKLDGLEAEPSAGVWPAIASGLNTGRRKRTIVPFLSIAASIIVFAGLGILFIPKKTINKHNQPVRSRVAGTVTSSVGVEPATINQRPVDKKSANLVKVTPPTHSAPTINPIVAKRPDTMANTTIPVEKDDQQLTASKQQDIIKAVVPGDATPLVMKPAAEQPMAFNNEPAQLAIQLPVISKNDATPAKARHKIHNLGGLVNLVVAKVDKRHDKVIEFSDNDDGGSNVASINLGIIKIKKAE